MKRPSLLQKTLLATAAAFVLYPAGGVAAPDGVSSIRWGTVALPSGQTLNVEIADTPALEQRGYMFRDRVPEGEGMIFLFDSLEIHPFWMKNCRTSLDIIWIDEHWRVLHIVAGVPPCREDPCPTFGPMEKSQYVLEVASGGAARLGLKPGDRVTYLPPTPSTNR